MCTSCTVSVWGVRAEGAGGRVRQPLSGWVELMSLGAPLSASLSRKFSAGWVGRC